SACCKARTGSNMDPDVVGLAETALTRHPFISSTHRRSSGPSHHRRLCCPPGSTGTTAAPHSPPPTPPPPQSIRSRTPPPPHNTRRSPGRGGSPQFPPPPSERSAPHTPRSSSRLQSRSYTASMAFTLISGARHSLCPTPKDGTCNDAAGFASCYGPLS